MTISTSGKSTPTNDPTIPAKPDVILAFRITYDAWVHSQKQMDDANQQYIILLTPAALDTHNAMIVEIDQRNEVQ